MLTAPRGVFYGVDLSRAALQAARCAGGGFRDCRLDTPDLRGIDLNGAKLNGASLRGADLRSLTLGANRQLHANLIGARLRCADLAGARLSGALLLGADLSWADLTGVDLVHADLRGAKSFACKLSVARREAAPASYGCCPGRVGLQLPCQVDRTRQLLHHRLSFGFRHIGKAHQQTLAARMRHCQCR